MVRLFQVADTFPLILLELLQRVERGRGALGAAAGTLVEVLPAARAEAAAVGPAEGALGDLQQRGLADVLGEVDRSLREREGLVELGGEAGLVLHEAAAAGHAPGALQPGLRQDAV